MCPVCKVHSEQCMCVYRSVYWCTMDDINVITLADEYCILYRVLTNTVCITYAHVCMDECL